MPEALGHSKDKTNDVSWGSIVPLRRFFAPFVLIYLLWGLAATAETLTVSTVTRPPFSMMDGDRETGFSIDLVRSLTDRLGWDYQLVRTDTFGEMLEMVRTGEVDMAAANISITAARETDMDFSHPIFESGLRIMVAAADVRSPSLIRVLFSADLMIAIAIAVVLLMGGGMLMWGLERRAQPYFDRPLKEAWFPSFWWALNLVVNGGFEERVPRTPIGRIFGVILVVSSLFVVSLFVAKITAVMTVEAISGSINSVNDLYDKDVGTLAESTAARFLERRDISYRGFSDLASLLSDFESGNTRVVVFDAPVLDHYMEDNGRLHGRAVGQVFLREDYGLLLPDGSPHLEEINRALLALRENGEYGDIYRKWFGKAP
ncbi:amino acid ABC transporter substrate-binding protein, PAAT family [Phaeobacter piscinae]|uniref:Amino acid ABC transporter substrate-binding protein, PAAT family n=1 Tax=Phaeobacter piscinae TaxID=1580596 RepID=A0AAN1GUI8_9RHOB|nr:amino acid ABC transporter substrate-binding protein, PAAT family [Phaeobacter piscinae]AUR37666.1 amino acid ABC transporter substrate-binding protein, PAAT family [Phaeobacter piscinae]